MLNYDMFLFVVLIVMGLVESGIVPHLQSIGFFCGDPKINYEFKGETVKPHVLMLVTLVIPYLSVSIELFKILTHII